MHAPLRTYIIGCLILTVFFIPGLFTERSPETTVPQVRGIMLTLIYQLPILLLLLGMTRCGGSSLRRMRGWRQLEKADIVLIPIMVTVTVGTAMAIPYRVKMMPEANGSATFTIAMMVLSITMACNEELFFRSWLLSELTDTNGHTWAAVTVSSMSFALLHHWQGWYGMVYAGVVGFIYALFFLRRRNIVTLMVSHSLHNALAIILSIRR